MPTNLRNDNKIFHPVSQALIEPIPHSKNAAEHGQAFYRAAVQITQSGDVEATLLAGSAKRLFELAGRTNAFHNNSALYNSPFPEQPQSAEQVTDDFIDP